MLRRVEVMALRFWLLNFWLVGLHLSHEYTNILYEKKNGYIYIYINISIYTYMYLVGFSVYIMSSRTFGADSVHNHAIRCAGRRIIVGPLIKVGLLLATVPRDLKVK